jgi:hypothetical protein
MEVDKYDYSKINAYEKTLLPDGFIGNVYNLSYKWKEIIPEYENPVKIMEIGVYHGANVCSYMKTYATHPKTEVHCVDPWMDYEEYPEYQNQQKTNYSIFMNNMSKLDSIDLNKIYIHRGLSSTILPTFEDESFDIIYIDGNHETKYVLGDAMLSMNKLKKGGWIIFDDTHDPLVKKGIDVFLWVTSTEFNIILSKNSQIFLKKK